MLVTLLIWLLFVQVIRLSGFCLYDMRAYSKDELLLKVVGGRIDENRNCCSIAIGDGVGRWGDFEDWLNLLLYPGYIAHVNSYFQRDHTHHAIDPNRPYYNEVQITNQCGEKGKRYGMDVTTETYQSALTRNKESKNRE